YNVSYDNRGRFYLDVFGNYCTKGERMKRGVTVDGEVNSGETNTATFEVFIPWEQTGVEVTDDWYPTEAYILPQCRIVAEGETYSRCTLGFVSERWRCDYQAMYYEFDDNGYTKADAADAVLGDAKNGFAKSAGWNLDKLSEKEVSLDKAYEYDYIFFRDAFAKNFEAVMTIYPGEYYRELDNGINYETNGLAYNTDGRSGFYLLLPTGQEFIPYLEFNSLANSAESGVKVPERYHLRSLDNFVDAWHVSDDICDIPNDKKEGAVEFRMIKYGADMFYFADGIYLGTQRVNELNGSAYVGIYNNSRASTYKNFDFKSYTDDEVKAVLDEQQIYTVNVTSTDGGVTECEQTWVKSGEQIVFKAVCESGYAVDKIMLGENDVTAVCMENVKRYGKYSIEAEDTANVTVTFKELEQTDCSTLSGMVYSGNDEKPSGATLKFACQTDPSVVYTVRATSAKGYSVSLPNGKYSVFVTFGSKDASTQEVTVSGDATWDIRSAPLNVESGSIKITDDGYFATEYNETNTRCYIDEVENGKPFVMETTIKDMSDKTWPSVGFILSTGGNNWIKFVLRLACPNEGEYYDTLIWHDDYTDNSKNYYVRVINFEDDGLKKNPFTGEDKTAKLRLVYSGNNYYFYVNDVLIYEIGQNESIQNGHGATLASTLGDGKVSLGLFAERQITFTKWNASSDYNDVFDVIGKTVDAEEGFVLSVNGKPVQDGKVLLGDEVTVTATTEGNFTFLLNGEMIATSVQDGKASATFTVTDNCTVTHTVVYDVSGTVTGGNASTVVTIVNEHGTVVYSGNTDSDGTFRAELANGKYYAVATSPTQMSEGAEINVNGSAVSGVSFVLAKPVIDEWTSDRYATNYKTGGYSSTDEDLENGGWFAGITAQKDSVYLLEADLENMGNKYWTDAGFMVGTNDNRLCFTVQYNIDNSTYRFVLWRKPGDPIVGQNVENPFVNGSMNVKLLYANSTYYFYVNNVLVYSNSEISAGDNVRVGLFSERQITFTDWSYTEGREVAQSFIGKELTVDAEMDVKVNGESVTVTQGKIAVLLGDEITVSITPQQGQTLSVMVDGNGIVTETIDGQAVATFTVTDDHAVSCSASFAVTGTVTGGDANTVVTIVNANGVKVGEANGAEFTFTVANGIYYVSAASATKISNVVTVNVNGGAATADALEFEKPLIDEWAHGSNRYTFDYTSGAYVSSADQDWNGGWFAGIQTQDNSVYVLEAVVKDMPTPNDKYPSAGFMVGTNENWLRFTVQWVKDNSTYRFV
ncbi:MAG: carboxypeptidase-like regulatory domain-containing protein, partial [Clostridia bacterium]|nr:carboxypeptidase-like regulatory domain-containing protein [Clostridia bacterium]